eukprot:scaffold5.g616.t1
MCRTFIMYRCAFIAICSLAVGALGSRHVEASIPAGAHGHGQWVNRTHWQMTPEQAALLVGTWTTKQPTLKFFSIDIADKLLKGTQDFKNMALVFPPGSAGAPKTNQRLEFVVWGVAPEEGFGAGFVVMRNGSDGPIVLVKDVAGWVSNRMLMFNSGTPRVSIHGFLSTESASLTLKIQARCWRYGKGPVELQKTNTSVDEALTEVGKWRAAQPARSDS